MSSPPTSASLSLGQDKSKIGLESHLSTPRRFNSPSLVPERLSSACTSKAEPSSCYWSRQNANSLMEMERPRKGHSKTSKKRFLADTKSLLNQDDYINHSWQKKKSKRKPRLNEITLRLPSSPVSFSLYGVSTHTERSVILCEKWNPVSSCKFFHDGLPLCAYMVCSLWHCRIWPHVRALHYNPPKAESGGRK